MMIQRGFKLETIWNDAEYMNKYTDFTVDDEAGRPFYKLGEFIDTVHE